MQRRFATREDAIEYDIRPGIGVRADGFDLDAIFEACYAYRTDGGGGFEQVVVGPEFWTAVKAAKRESTGAAHGSPPDDFPPAQVRSVNRWLERVRPARRQNAALMMTSHRAERDS